MFHGEEVFALLAREPRAFPGARFVGHETFGATFGDDEPRTIAALPGRLRDQGVDAVVSRTGCADEPAVPGIHGLLDPAAVGANGSGRISCPPLVSP